MKRLKSRFCPSPTGFIHLGNVRTALFNALLAAGQNGTFLLRIEDTDRTRSGDNYTQALMQDLRWLGLDWNEGPGKEAENGPYYQSERQAIYDRYYSELEKKGLAYPCFCSEEELSLARKLQRASGKPPRYSGTCRNLSPEQVAEKLSQGLKPTLRFRIPHDQVTTFVDLVKDEQRFDNNDIGDFIIRRADGTSPFMFCNAIDDATMSVTHALRGEDHLTNTPRQVMILRSLDLPAPHYAHISLIMGADGTPLSKRNGSLSVQELREQGYLPLAIVNYLARLGHYYAEECFMSFAELANKFSLDHLGKASARFDLNQLLHWQHETIRQMSDEEIWQWMGEAVHKWVPAKDKSKFIASIKTNITFPKDAAHWAWVIYNPDLGYGEAQEHVLRDTNPRYFVIALETVLSGSFELGAIISKIQTELNLKGRSLYQPLRVAISGELHGPELPHLMELIGIERVKLRLESVINKTKQAALN